MDKYKIRLEVGLRTKHFEVPNALLRKDLLCDILQIAQILKEEVSC